MSWLSMPYVIKDCGLCGKNEFRIQQVCWQKCPPAVSIIWKNEIVLLIAFFVSVLGTGYYLGLWHALQQVLTELDFKVGFFFRIEFMFRFSVRLLVLHWFLTWAHCCNVAGIIWRFIKLETRTGCRVNLWGILKLEVLSCVWETSEIFREWTLLKHRMI